MFNNKQVMELLRNSGTPVYYTCFRKTCKVKNIREWVREEKEKEKDGTTYRKNDRQQIQNCKRPNGRKSTGRPRKRWYDDI
jgi:ferredoxin